MLGDDTVAALRDATMVEREEEIENKSKLEIGRVTGLPLLCTINIKG